LDLIQKESKEPSYDWPAETQLNMQDTSLSKALLLVLISW